MKRLLPQFLLILLGVGAAVGVYASSKIGSLSDAASSLQYQVNNVQLHKVDLSAKQIAVKLNIDFTNPTDTTLTVDNLVVKVHIPDEYGRWLQLASSRPTGKVSVVPGFTQLPLRFDAPIASEMISIIPRIFQGNSQKLMVEIFPQVLGHNLKPVTTEIDFNPNDTINNLLANLGIGYTGDGPVKNIVRTQKYDHLFPLADVKGTETHISSGSHYGTLDEMKRIVNDTLSDTAQVAKYLKKSTTEATLKAVFNLANDHIQYKLDEPGREQLRRPIRTWADRQTGVDCDCFSIFLSSILTNLKIPHSFRMAAYDASKSFAHVYVIAKSGNKTFTLDPVKGKWNTEHGPITKIYDLKVV